MTEYFLLACAAVLTAGYVGSLICFLRRDGPSFRTGMLLGVLYLVFPPLWVMLVTGRLRVLTPFAGTALRDAMLDQYLPEITVLLLYLAAILAALLLSAVIGRSRAGASDAIEPVSCDWLIYLIGYLAVTFGFALVSGAFRGGHWYQSRASFLRESSAGAFFPFTAWALRFLIVGCVAARVAGRRWSWGKGLAVLALVSGVELMFVGNRVFILMAVAVTALVVAWRSGLVALLWFGIAAAPIGYAMVVYQEIRAMLFSASASDIAATVRDSAGTPVKTFEDYVLSVTESININVVLQAFHDFGQRFDFLHGATLAKIFLVWIPRGVWPDKPLPITEYAGAAFGPNANVALVTTIIGEFHMNFGWLALAVLPSFLFVVCLIARPLEDNPVRRYVLTAFGFLIVRLPVSDMMLAVLIALVGYRLLAELTKRRLPQPVGHVAFD